MDLAIEIRVLLRAFPLSKVLDVIIREVEVFGDQSTSEELALEHLRSAAGIARIGEEHSADIKST